MIGRVLPLMALGGAAYSQQEEAEALVNTVLDTVRVGVTQYEIANIRHRIHLDQINGSSLREIRRDFSDYIRRHFDSQRSDPSLDMWDEPYWLESSSGEWFLGSNGPDQYWDTEDDVWIIVEDEA